MQYVGVGQATRHPGDPAGAEALVAMGEVGGGVKDGLQERSPTATASGSGAQGRGRFDATMATIVERGGGAVRLSRVLILGSVSRPRQRIKKHGPSMRPLYAGPASLVYGIP